MGVISEREQITKLLDYPDLASVTHWFETAENDIEWRISKILDESEYVAPDPMMNLELARSRMQLAYLEALQQDVEQEKLEMMLTFITEAQALIDQATPEAMGPMSQMAMEQAGGAMGDLPEMTTESPLELPPETETAPPPETLPS